MYWLSRCKVKLTFLEISCWFNNVVRRQVSLAHIARIHNAVAAAGTMTWKNNNIEQRQLLCCHLNVNETMFKLWVGGSYAVCADIVYVEAVGERRTNEWDYIPVPSSPSPYERHPRTEELLRALSNDDDTTVGTSVGGMQRHLVTVYDLPRISRSQERHWRARVYITVPMVPWYDHNSLIVECSLLFFKYLITPFKQASAGTDVGLPVRSWY